MCFRLPFPPSLSPSLRSARRRCPKHYLSISRVVFQGPSLRSSDFILRPYPHSVSSGFSVPPYFLIICSRLTSFFIPKKSQHGHTWPVEKELDLARFSQEQKQSFVGRGRPKAEFHLQFSNVPLYHVDTHERLCPFFCRPHHWKARSYFFHGALLILSLAFDPERCTLFFFN